MTKTLVSFDWAMKKILRSKANFEILEGFLSELIAPDKDLKIVNVLESESNKNSKDDKFNRVDILVQVDQGDLILVEVQSTRQIDYLHRILYGTSKVVTEHIKEGDAYEKIKKVYCVNILYFDLGQGDDYIYHGKTDFLGVHKHDQLKLCEDQRKLYNAELVSDIYPEYYLIKVNQFNDLAKNTLDQWIYFLKNSDIKADFNAKGIKKAQEELNVLKLSDEERKEYEHHREYLHYEASVLNTEFYYGKKEGLVEGKAEGKAEGIAESKRTIALSMLKENVDINFIAKITGLSVDEIKRLN